MPENTELAPISFAEMTEIIDQEFKQREQKQPQSLPDWYLAKLADIEAKRQLVKAQAARITHLLDMEETGVVYKFGKLFREQFEADLIAKKGKGKYIDYMFGRAKKISQQDRLDITDEKAAINWAEKSLPRAVKIEKSILNTPLAKHLEETGELPDGCEIVPGREKIYPVCDYKELGQEATAIVEGLLAAPGLAQAEPKVLADISGPSEDMDAT